MSGLDKLSGRTIRQVHPAGKAGYLIEFEDDTVLAIAHDLHMRAWLGPEILLDVAPNGGEDHK